MNLSRYPWLTDLSSPEAVAHVSAARSQLERYGVVTFPSFLTAAGLEDARHESSAKANAAFRTNALHNVYQLPGSDQRYPTDHIRNRQYRTRVAR